MRLGHNLRLKYSLRLSFLILTVVAVVLAMWIRTYSVHGYYSNGKVAWEQFENRTIFMNVKVSKRVTWFPSGTIAIVWTPADVTYYSPSGDTFNGNNRNEVEMWAGQYRNLLDEDNVTNSERRPLESLLLWFNAKLPKIKTTP